MQNHVDLKASNQILFGRHPVIEALEQNASVDKVLLLQGTRGELEITLRHLCKEKNVALQMVPKEKLNFLVKGNHQGVVAFISPIGFQRIEDVIPHIFERGEMPLLVILDGITDVRNFGAIARSAEVFGAHALVIATKGGAQLNADALKASAGALLHIPVCREPSLVNAVAYIRQCGIQVMVTDLQAEKHIHQMDFRVPLALVIGAEGKGISYAIAKESDAQFLIPQIGKTDSLNASVAAGIILYEALRQRTASQ